jgi:apolipoprotein N-acyltransferase
VRPADASRRESGNSASFAARLFELTDHLSDRITSATGWPRAGIAFLAGTLSVAAMAPFFFSPVLFVTLPVLVWLIDGSRAEGADPAWWRAALRAGQTAWWFGFGYFLFGLFWIGEAFLVEADKFAWLMPFAVVSLPAGLALFTGLAAAAARLVWPHGFARVLVLAIALALAEWLRGHVLTGFPWNVLGYALTWPLPMMQAAALVGVYGLTLLAVAIFAGPLVVIADAARGTARPRTAAIAGALGIAPLLVLYGYGAWQLSDAPSPMLDGVRIRIVQASVPQRDKWRPEKQGQIFQDQLDLSRRDASGKQDDLAGITHLIWPEAAMPFLPLDHPEALSAIGQLLPPSTHLISGALRVKRKALPASESSEAFNSLMVFGDQGNLETLYDKIHLVPFGEYLPMQSALEAIGLEQLTRWRGGFSSGAVPRTVLNIPGLPPVAGLICYEAIFPSEIVQGSQRPGFLINLTNDGWFGNSTGPRQHFHQTRVRAVEEGLPIVRAANNGISAVVDGRGRVISKLSLNARGVIDSGVPHALAPNLYGQLGDCTFVGLVLIFIAVAVVLARRAHA